MKYRYRMNMAGLVYLAITLLVGVAATVRPNNILVWVFGLLLSLILVSGIISGTSLFRMTMRRLDPGHGRVGRPLVVRYQVRGGSRLIPLFDLSVSEVSGSSARDWSRFSRPNPAWIMHVGPSETAHGESVLVPDRRGRMRLDRIVASSSFPFGLLGKVVEISQPMETLVHPDTVPLSAAALDRLFDGFGDGDRSGRRTGPVGEYAGLREYRFGDSIRSVAWKRWVPGEEPLVVQRASPSPRRLRLVLDLRRPTSELRLPEGEDRRAREERAITLAASIAESVILAGGEVGLLPVGPAAPEVRAHAGRRQLDRILTVLAGIDFDEDRASTPLVGNPGHGCVTVVVHVDRVDPDLGGEAAVHLLPSSLEGLAEDGLAVETEAVRPGRGSRVA